MAAKQRMAARDDLRTTPMVRLVLPPAKPKALDGANPKIIHAAFEGNLSVLSTAPKDAMSVPGVAGLTPLHAAAIAGSETCLAFLLRKNASANVVDDAGRTPLHYSVFYGHINTTEQLLRKTDDQHQRKFDKNSLGIAHLAAAQDSDMLLDIVCSACPQLLHQCNIYGLTPLHVALLTKKDFCIDWILNQGVDLHATTNNGMTAVHFAAAKNLGDFLEVILDDCGNPLAVAENGMSPFHVAFQLGRKDSAECLMQYEEAKNWVQTDREGLTPLHWAAVMGNKECISLALDPKDGTFAFGDINSPDDHGRTLLHCAARSGCRALVSTLLKAGAGTWCEDKNGRIPLFYAAVATQHQVHGAACSPCDAFRVLRNKSQIDHRDNEGRTVLHWACYRGNDIAAKQLLDDHAYRKKPVFMFVGAQDVNGWTAFHFAAHEGHVDCIEELVLAGTSCIDYLDSEGRTALFYAAAQGHTETTQRLLQCGANPNGSEVHSVLLAAVRKGRDLCVRLLLNGGVNINTTDKSGRSALHVACQMGHHSLVRPLMEHGANINAQDDYGRTPVHYAVASNSLLCLEELCSDNSLVHGGLTQGWRRNLSLQDKCGFSVVHYAVIMNHVECFNILLNCQKSCVMYLSSQNRNALHYIAYHQRSAMFELIKTKLGRLRPMVIEQQDCDGRTPLDTACFVGCLPVTNGLLEMGCDCNCTDKTGRTPLMAAAYSQNVLCMKALFKNGADRLAVDSRGRTALHRAAARGNANEVVALLRFSPPSISAIRDHDGRTAADLAFMAGEEATGNLVTFVGEDQRRASLPQTALQKENTPTQPAATTENEGWVLSLLGRASTAAGKHQSAGTRSWLKFTVREEEPLNCTATASIPLRNRELPQRHIATPARRTRRKRSVAVRRPVESTPAVVRACPVQGSAYAPDEEEDPFTSFGSFVDDPVPLESHSPDYSRTSQPPAKQEQEQEQPKHLSKRPASAMPKDTTPIVHRSAEPLVERRSSRIARARAAQTPIPAHLHSSKKQGRPVQTLTTSCASDRAKTRKTARLQSRPKTAAISRVQGRSSSKKTPVYPKDLSPGLLNQKMLLEKRRTASARIRRTKLFSDETPSRSMHVLGPTTPVHTTNENSANMSPLRPLEWSLDD